MKNSLQSKIITGTVLVVSCFIVAYFFTTPQWTRYSQTKIKLDAKLAEGEQLTQALDTMDAFVTQFNTHKSDLAKVNLALPVKTPDLSNMLTSYSALAQASGLTLSNFTIEEGRVNEKPDPANTIQTAHIVLSASGSFESFKDFVMRLETDLRISDIDHVTVKADSGQILYVINLRTYYQK